MDEHEITAIDAYLNRVYKIILLIVPAAALMASATFTAFKLCGWYAELNALALALFVCFDLGIAATSAYFTRTSFDADGLIIPRKLRAGKRFIACAIILQWNFITYLIPFTGWWAYAFFFVALSVFFFDTRLTALVASGVTASTLVSWLVVPNTMLPSDGTYLMPSLVLRLICITLSMLVLVLLARFGGKYLVEELERYASYDTLTHLLNRRNMDNYLQEAYRQAGSGHAPFCLLMMDIDDFKQVNDIHGHECGDEVLKSVAMRVTRCVGEHDSVFRWGGEEILVLIRGDEDLAQRIAEQIRASIAGKEVSFRGGAVRVTVTIGISGYHAGVRLEDMMTEADEKLYFGKRHGKNQVVLELPSE